MGYHQTLCFLSMPQYDNVIVYVCDTENRNKVNEKPGGLGYYDWYVLCVRFINDLGKSDNTATCIFYSTITMYNPTLAGSSAPSND